MEGVLLSGPEDGVAHTLYTRFAYYVLAVLADGSGGCGSIRILRERQRVNAIGCPEPREVALSGR